MGTGNVGSTQAPTYLPNREFANPVFDGNLHTHVELDGEVRHLGFLQDYFLTASPPRFQPCVSFCVARPPSPPRRVEDNKKWST